MKEYNKIPDRGWVYCRDNFAAIEWRWDKKDSQVKFIDCKNRIIVNETGISLVRVIRLYQTYL